MFESPYVFIFIGVGIVFLIIIRALWKHSGQGINNDWRHYGDEAPVPRQQYPRYDLLETAKPRSPTTQFSPGQTNTGGAYQDSEIEAIKSRLSNIERALVYIQQDLADLDSDRGKSRSGATGTPPRPNSLMPTQNYPETYYDPSLNRDAYTTASEAYLKLSSEGLRDLLLEPVFVVLDMDSSTRGSAIGEAKRNFKRSANKQSAFIIFKEGPIGGWIFPNPRISFTEAMKYVFPDLSHENFEETKNGVKPRKVRATSDGEWETVVS